MSNRDGTKVIGVPGGLVAGIIAVCLVTAQAGARGPSEPEENFVFTFRTEEDEGGSQWGRREREARTMMGGKSQRKLRGEVSLNHDSTSLSEVVAFLREVTSLNYVLFERDIPRGGTEVTIHFEGTVREGLDRICKKTKMVWTANPQTVFICRPARLYNRYVEGKQRLPARLTQVLRMRMDFKSETVSPARLLRKVVHEHPNRVIVDGKLLSDDKMGTIRNGRHGLTFGELLSRLAVKSQTVCRVDEVLFLCPLDKLSLNPGADGPAKDVQRSFSREIYCIFERIPLKEVFAELGKVVDDDFKVKLVGGKEVRRIRISFQLRGSFEEALDRICRETGLRWCITETKKIILGPKLEVARACRKEILLSSDAWRWRVSTPVTLQFDETPLPQVLREISRQAGLRVRSIDGEAGRKDKVTLNGRMEVGKALESIHKQTSLVWCRPEPVLVMKKKEDHLPAFRSSGEGKYRRFIGSMNPQIKKTCGAVRLLDHESTPLSGVVGFLRQVTDVEYLLVGDSKSGNRASTERKWKDQYVTLHYEGKLGKAIDILCEMAGVAWTTQRGKIVIGPPESLKRMCWPTAGRVPPDVRGRLNVPVGRKLREAELRKTLSVLGDRIGELGRATSVTYPQREGLLASVRTRMSVFDALNTICHQTGIVWRLRHGVINIGPPETVGYPHSPCVRSEWNDLLNRTVQLYHDDAPMQEIIAFLRLVTSINYCFLDRGLDRDGQPTTIHVECALRDGLDALCWKNDLAWTFQGGAVVIGNPELVRRISHPRVGPLPAGLRGKAMGMIQVQWQNKKSSAALKQLGDVFQKKGWELQELKSGNRKGDDTINLHGRVTPLQALNVLCDRRVLTWRAAQKKILVGPPERIGKRGSLRVGSVPASMRSRLHSKVEFDFDTLPVRKVAELLQKATGLQIVGLKALPADPGNTVDLHHESRLEVILDLLCYQAGIRWKAKEGKIHFLPLSPKDEKKPDWWTATGARHGR